jgi:O-antigen ligase
MIEQAKFIMLLLFLIVILLSLIYFKTLKSYFVDSLKTFSLSHWALILASASIFTLGYRGDLAAATGYIFQQLSLIVFAGLIVMLAIIRNSDRLHFNYGILGLVLYGFVGILSSTYSPNFAMTTYKALQILFCAAIIVALLANSNPYKSVTTAFSIVYVYFFFLFMGAIINAVLYPDITLKLKEDMVMPMLSGGELGINPNSMGVLTGVLCIVFLRRWLDSSSFKEKTLNAVLLFASIFGVIFAQSRTALGALMVASAFLLFMKKRVAYLGLVLLLGSTVMLFGLGEESLVLDYVKRGQTEESFASWSGRIPAWQFAFEKFKESPLLGYGMVGVRFGAITGFMGHMHNSYMEVLLSVGLLGFLPWLLCLGFTSWVILRRALAPPIWLDSDGRKFHSEVAAIIVFFLVATIARTSFVIFNYDFLLYICLIAYASLFRIYPMVCPLSRPAALYRLGLPPWAMRA